MISERRRFSGFSNFSQKSGTLPKLLIAGGGYADVPLIHSGRRLGYHVITSGNRVTDMGHQYSDECRLEDFSDKEAILRLAKKLKVDAICPCCNDFSAISCAYAAEEMGLPGHDSYETALILHHKDQYRKFSRDNHVPSPVGEGFSNALDALDTIRGRRFPLMVKPVDLSGGKGITKLEKIEEAPAAIENALHRSKAGRIVVEEFIEGSRHGFSAFLRDGRVVFCFLDNEHYYQNPYLVAAASTPSPAPGSVSDKLRLETERISNILNLSDGIFHAQFILRENEPVMIEVTRRSPGDLYTRLVEHATGVDYPGYIVKAAAGLDISRLRQEEPRGFFSRVCIMAEREGIVKDIVFDPWIEDKIIEKIIWGKPGESVDDATTCKLGIVFLKFGSMDEMLAKTEKMSELIRVILD
ncbi:Phosphoribosylglycinamide synthetase [Candidatus Desulfarcum epimagneticum]|uniref:Phosphoribosylglycinamide synthetase n=1 Tax=uncultured Desulfobacteraceae bacterium TaxID=218296 RepID=A0A484HHN1_9BACT|nr:Phosphoribosylglycinamide synthetase [uncultured Desulfobacteraceae bacterium]